MSRTTAAAKSLTTAATLFAGPGRASNSTPSVSDSASFRFVLDGSIQTLSTENAPTSGPIRGLLFVPTLDADDLCNNITAQYVPANVTRIEDISEFGYQIIGLAPWVSANCTRSFLNASQRSGTEALVFFLPSSNDTKPPLPDDPIWSLEDGWKDQNHYPVYAIPGSAGATLMTQLALYSGSNQSSHESDQWDVRLFTVLDLEKPGKKMPSLWGFILAILGTILVLSIILLLCYQLIQKRRRENLQRRIEAGDADFEQLGLHQIKVPQEVLDSLPIYTYSGQSEVAKDDAGTQVPHENSATSSQSGGRVALDCMRTRMEKESGEDPEHQIVQSARFIADGIVEQVIDTGKPKASSATVEVDSAPSSQCITQATYPSASDSQIPYPNHHNRLSHTQTTCAICLDDFVLNSSTVRELPCGHIYHPECINASLTQNSSLCPLCKKSVLPTGYYPMPVTNLMVQRDSMLRRSR